ncbi:MAG: hypothetical protein QOI41_4531 [Myxococcales bacterium]|nr:hypothetical protein [Myxococcales bacterium]
MLTRALPLLSIASLLCFAACAAPASAPDAEAVDVSEDGLSTTYGNLLETLPAADLDRWIAARASLAAGFDRICGDTICGGDYSNLSTVRIACSSTTKARKLKDCAWVLGGNIDEVDGRTGKIVTTARVFTCKVPVASSAKAMLDVLSAAGDDALNAPLPGTGKSFYDALTDCFSGVVGPAPIAQTASFYSELGEYSWGVGETEGAAWSATQRKLAQGFDDVCGDSFCEGDYSDITPLRLACSVNKNTKRVSRCSWSFAAADLSVDARGAIVTRSTTKRCNIEIGATASALATALSGDDPLNAKLPGRTTSIYDALVGCL